MEGLNIENAQLAETEKEVGPEKIAQFSVAEMFKPIMITPIGGEMTLSRIRISPSINDISRNQE